MVFYVLSVYWNKWWSSSWWSFLTQMAMTWGFADVVDGGGGCGCGRRRVCGWRGMLWTWRVVVVIADVIVDVFAGDMACCGCGRGGGDGCGCRWWHIWACMACSQGGLGGVGRIWTGRGEGGWGLDQPNLDAERGGAAYLSFHTVQEGVGWEQRGGLESWLMAWEFKRSSKYMITWLD